MLLFDYYFYLKFHIQNMFEIEDVSISRGFLNLQIADLIPSFEHIYFHENTELQQFYD